MGEALDWMRQISLENDWKALKVRIGPGVYLLVGNHPDAAQVILRAGQLIAHGVNGSYFIYVSSLTPTFICRSKVRSNL